MNLISVISQQRLVEVLSHREVLLRLIGAERVMASTICLLLKGVAVACTPSKSANPIAEFLVRVAPPPACCVAIVALRDHALPLGIAVVVAPRVTGSPAACSLAYFVAPTLLTLSCQCGTPTAATWTLQPFVWQC